jgi:short-subunit dehydrogenase
MKLKPLEIRRALITGASAGIGEAFAHEFANNGFDLVLVARRKDKLEKLARKLERESGVHVDIIACDLAATGAPEALEQACAETPIDVLVNNAGIMYRGNFSEQEMSSIDSIVQLNIHSLTRLSRLFLEQMLRRGNGRIHNVTSTTAFHAGPTFAVYAASKAYILSFTEAMAEELRGSGVSATAFCPGSTDTHMVVESFGEDLRSDSFGSLLMMSSEDVAREGFKACMAGTTVSVPGVANNVISALGRLQPKWLNRRLQSLVYSKLLD